MSEPNKPDPATSPAGGASDGSCVVETKESSLPDAPAPGETPQDAPQGMVEGDPKAQMQDDAPQAQVAPKETGGREGLDPTRYGDWEKAGRCIDF